jgi:hypothetical protein
MPGSVTFVNHFMSCNDITVKRWGRHAEWCLAHFEEYFKDSGSSY